MSTPQASPMRVGSPSTPPAPVWRRAFAWLAAASLGVAGFALYMDPGLQVQVSDLIWACFP